MEPFVAVVLAAGLGKRSGSKLPKVLLETAERKPLVSYVLESIKDIGPARLALVVGYEHELVQRTVSPLVQFTKPLFCRQEAQLGTGDAVKSAKECLADWQGPILILCGDMPLVSSKTLTNLLTTHESLKATLTLLTVSLTHDNGFGRVVRDGTGNVTEIVERKDCKPEQLGIAERNVGVYCVDSSFLFPALDRLQNNNTQAEYYLTDIVKLASDEGQTVASVPCFEIEEALGVNDQSDLMLVNEALRNRQITRLALQGVKFLAPSSVIVDAQAKIGAGVTIGPSVQILGLSEIGEGSVIEGSAIIKDSKVGKRCTLRLGSYLTEASIDDEVTIGPFVQLRPKTKLGKGVAIGNFVELKNATLAPGAKANHLSYLGDCEIGEGSNIGAGTITCNYDGIKKK